MSQPTQEKRFGFLGVYPGEDEIYLTFYKIGNRAFLLAFVAIVLVIAGIPFLSPGFFISSALTCWIIGLLTSKIPYFQNLTEYDMAQPDPFSADRPQY